MKKSAAMICMSTERLHSFFHPVGTTVLLSCMSSCCQRDSALIDCVRLMSLRCLPKEIAEAFGNASEIEHASEASLGVAKTVRRAEQLFAPSASIP
eukprot:3032775-Amphidinium_carterae.2